MPHAAGQLTQCGQALLADHFFLGILQFARALRYFRFQAEIVFLQRLLGTFAPGDNIENGYKVALLRTVDRDGKPHFQRFDIVLKCFGDAGQRHPAISLEQLRIRCLDTRDDLGDFPAHHPLQAGEGFKSPVHLQVDKVLRAVLLEDHPAIRKAVQHILEQGAEARLRSEQGICRLDLTAIKAQSLLPPEQSHARPNRQNKHSEKKQSLPKACVQWRIHFTGIHARHQEPG